MFENRVLRRIFGPKRDEVTGGWRKLHNTGKFLSSCTTGGFSRRVNFHEVSLNLEAVWPLLRKTSPRN
jgi:hypothetical protein